MAGRCRNGHEKPYDGECKFCRLQRTRRKTAKREGYPLCPKGHGLVPANLDWFGRCIGCDAAGERLCDATRHVKLGDGPCRECKEERERRKQAQRRITEKARRAERHRWLDWVVVKTAYEGHPPPRALTRYERACLIHTIKTVAGVPLGGIEHYTRHYLHVRISWQHAKDTLAWAKEQKLPLMTPDEALFWEVTTPFHEDEDEAA